MTRKSGEINRRTLTIGVSHIASLWETILIHELLTTYLILQNFNPLFLLDSLPEFTFVNWIHERSYRTFEGSSKVMAVHGRNDYSIIRFRMCREGRPFGCKIDVAIRAPGVGFSQEEQLFI